MSKIIQAAQRMAEVADADELLDVLRDECAALGSQKAWATQNGISPAYVNDLLQGRREISDRVAGMLGFERHVIFVSSGDSDRQADPVIEQAEALLYLDAEGALVPHGIGGLARKVISNLITRLRVAAAIRYADGAPHIRGPLVEEEAADLLGTLTAPPAEQGYHFP